MNKPLKNIYFAYKILLPLITSMLDIDEASDPFVQGLLFYMVD